MLPILFPAHAEILVQFHACAYAALVPVLHEPVDIVFQHIAFQVELKKSHFSLLARRRRQFLNLDFPTQNEKTRQKAGFSEISKAVKATFGTLYGAGTRSRTRDLLITSQLLYQLSYTGVMGCEYIESDALVKPSCLIQLKKIDRWRFGSDAGG